MVGTAALTFDLALLTSQQRPFSDHLVEALQAPSLTQGDFSNSIFFLKKKSCEILKICSLDSER